MAYKTKNRILIINFFEEHKEEHFSIQEVMEQLKDIPQPSIYRLIDNLVEEGILIRLNIDPSQSYYYQYADHDEDDDHSHIHLICEKCGKLIHLDCDEVEHFSKHIEEEHNFKVNIAKVNLYGLCEECRNKQ